MPCRYICCCQKQWMANTKTIQLNRFSSSSFLFFALASDRLFKSCTWGRKGECLSTSRCVWCLKSFAGFKHLFPNSQQPLIRAFNKTERRENQRVGMRRHVHPSKVTTFLDKRLPFPGREVGRGGNILQITKLYCGTERVLSYPAGTPASHHPSAKIMGPNFQRQWSRRWKTQIYVTLEHKSSVESLGYICSNSQKHIVWVKIIDFLFYAKNH